MQLILFWTDILFYLLVLLSLLIVWKSRYHPTISALYTKLKQQRLAISASIVLILYLSIALLDSIHFKYVSTQQNIGTISVLDFILSPLDKPLEKTYSKPFALQSFSKEIQKLTNSNIQEHYPYLSYIDAKIRTKEQFVLQFQQDLRTGLLHSVVFSLLLLNFIAITSCYFQGGSLLAKLKEILFGKKPLARFYWLNICFFSTLLILCFEFSRHYHILGTDIIGQDVFYLTIKSIRTGLMIGTLTTLIMLPFAIFLGMIAGYIGGRVDDMIQYLYTTISSIPSILLIAASILSLQVLLSQHPQWFPSLQEQADLRLLVLCGLLGVTSWTNLCRLIRAETLKLRETDYVSAAIALGTSQTKILWSHILPNVFHVILITIVLDFSTLVLAEAVLSYVGVGVDPTTISWGNMINSARLELAREPIVWWPLIAAFIAMFILVLSANIFADTVREALDPRTLKN